MDATASGLIQTSLTSGAAALFAEYSQYKGRQGRIEDAIRRTLFSNEALDDKLRRLLELLPAVDQGMTLPAATVADAHDR